LVRGDCESSGVGDGLGPTEVLGVGEGDAELVGDGELEDDVADGVGEGSTVADAASDGLGSSGGLARASVVEAPKVLIRITKAVNQYVPRCHTGVRTQRPSPARPIPGCMFPVWVKR
jgi:hypothetical protein